MTNFRRHILVKTFMLYDLAALSSAFGVSAIWSAHSNTITSLAAFFSMRIKVSNLLLLLAFLFSWHVIFSAFGLYRSRRLETRRREALDALKATLVCTIVLGLSAALFRIHMITFAFLIMFWVTSCSIIIPSRLLMRQFLGWVRVHGRNLRHILIAGTNPRALQFAQVIADGGELGYRLIGFADDEWAGSQDFRKTGWQLLGNLDNFPTLLRECVIDEVVIALPLNSFYLQASRIVAQCEEQGVIIRFLSSIFDLRQDGWRADNVADPDATILVSTVPFEGWPLVVKRTLDILISFTVLVFSVPLFLMVGLLVKFDSTGPIFFVQERVGFNKRRFSMYKFRTMVADAESLQDGLENRNEAAGPVFKIRDDPRVTRIGKILRKNSIDELPQLFNVLKGDMSLVGPRPLPVRDYDGFDQDWLRRRFSVRPGVTCLWQISGRSTLSFQKWMELDMAYIDQWSFWLDFLILAKTIPAVLRKSGAV